MSVFSASLSRVVATGWTGLGMLIPLLPDNVPAIGADAVSLVGQRGGVDRNESCGFRALTGVAAWLSGR